MKELFAALARAQAAYKPVQKSGVNTYFNNAKYPTLEDYIEASKEALSANGLSVIQELMTLEGKLCITTTIAHSSGEFRTSSFQLILTKQDMQGLGSATTYGRRYAYAAVTGLAPEDDDANTATDKDPKDKTKSMPIDPPKEQSVKKPEESPPKTLGPSEKQLKRLFALRNKAKWSDEEAKLHMKEMYNCASSKDLTANQYKHFCDLLDKGKTYLQSKDLGAVYE